MSLDPKDLQAFMTTSRVAAYVRILSLSLQPPRAVSSQICRVGTCFSYVAVRSSKRDLGTLCALTVESGVEI